MIMGLMAVEKNIILVCFFLYRLYERNKKEMININ